MSDLNPWSVLFDLAEPEQRERLIAYGGLGLILAVAHWGGPGTLHSGLAVLALLAIPLLALRLTGRAAVLFLLLSAVGTRLAFHPGYEGDAPVVLLYRLAYFALPPLVVGLVLRERDRARLKVGLVHLFAPALVAGVGVVIHLIVRWGTGLETSEPEILWAAGIYGTCYLILLIVGLIARIGHADEGAQPSGPGRAAVLEEEGRHDMAARAYEREGQAEKGAQAAERAGDWVRAARLYRSTGDDFNAGEMYYSAKLWQDALDCYERAQSFPAAARLCVQLGQHDRAASLYEQAGDRAAAIRVLEESGRRPTGEQYRRAGLMDRAAAVFAESGDWLRAAQVYEHDLQDLERAAALHLKAGSFLQAGRLFEAQGKVDQALEAYAAIPAGAVDAARLHLRAGRAPQAAELLARLPAAELDKLEDEATLTLVARVMVETNRIDEAARILQGLKRKGSASGAVHLLLGRAFLNKGLPDLAEEALRTATTLPLEPAEEIQAAYLLGCLLETAGRHDEARPIFRDILQKDLHYADVEERYRRLTAPAKPVVG